MNEPWEVTLGTEQEYQGVMIWKLDFEENDDGWAAVTLTPGAGAKLSKPMAVIWDKKLDPWPPDCPKWLKQMIGAWGWITAPPRPAGLYHQNRLKEPDAPGPALRNREEEEQEANEGFIRRLRDYLK